MMKKSALRGAAVLAAGVAISILSGCAAETTSKEAGLLKLGTRICVASTNSEYRTQSSTWTGTVLEMFNWDSIKPRENEWCSSGIPVTVNSRSQNLHFASLYLQAENPNFGKPTVTWAEQKIEDYQPKASLGVGEKASAEVNGLTFTVERRADSDKHKEFLVTMTK